MWASFLQRHFPSSNWKKYYSKIIFNSLSVFHGLKPSFLWDIGPGVTPTQVLCFTKECKSLLKNNDDVLVICIDKNIFVTNTTRCLKTLTFNKFFIEIQNQNFQLLKLNDNLKQMIGLLETKFSTCEDCQIWDLSPSEIICPPSLFGLLLGYPLVYYFDSDYPPFSVKLKVYEVSCEFRFEDVAGRFQIFAFSIPQSVLNTDIDNTVSLWFNNLQFSGENIFSNLSLESSFEEIFCKNYVKIIKKKPKCSGVCIIRCGFLKEAAHYFRKCLAVNPYFLRAARNLENVSNLAVERWHFRMLNDQHRNEAFREAILKKIKQGFDRVLDVGTGTGILRWCYYLPNFIAITGMAIGNYPLHKRELAVTENCLFCSEGKAKQIYACDSSPVMTEIAEQVFHSNNIRNVKLINKHSTELRIPEDALGRVSLLVTEIFDAGLLGEGILQTLSHAWKHLLLPPRAQSPGDFGVVIPFGATVYATGIEFNPAANDFHLKRMPNLFSFENDVLQACDNYDTQDLSRRRYKPLTESEKILEVCFNDPDAVDRFLQGWKRDFALRCKTSGRLDCFAVWFDLHLDEDIVLSTSPFSKNEAWDQAVFPLPKSAYVEEEQNITISVAFKKKLSICLNNPYNGVKPSESVIATLNNEKLSNALNQVVHKLTGAFCDSVNVLDCYPFPVFGLNFLINRKSRFRDELTCFVPTENDRRLVNTTAEKYNIAADVVVTMEIDFECLHQKRFDVILVDLVETSGEVKDGVLLQLNYLKSLLKPGGIILPDHVSVIGQFIHSDWLGKASKVVNDVVTCGYNIADHINIYQVQHFIDLDFKSVETVNSSEAFELFSLFDSLESINEMKVPRHPDNTLANAMVYWLKIKFLQGCDEIVTNDGKHYRQGAVLFPKTEFPSEIKFNIIRNNGLFNVELLKG